VYDERDDDAPKSGSQGVEVKGWAGWKWEWWMMWWRWFEMGVMSIDGRDWRDDGIWNTHPLILSFEETKRETEIETEAR
jgi:hypothetical protein